MTAELRGLTSEEQLNLLRYRDKVSLLNLEFIKALEFFYEQDKHYDFTETVNSYVGHQKQLREMYGMDKPRNSKKHSKNGKDVTDGEKKSEKTELTSLSKKAEPEQIKGRVIAKAKRRTNNDDTLTSKTPKTSSIGAPFASSPSVTIAPKPEFGDISQIDSTPQPSRVTKPVETVVAQGPRKRAIRGGGPLGGSESVVFKGNEEKKEELKIPPTTIKFPKAGPEFWNKPSGVAPEKAGNLFAFLGKEGDSSVPKFTGFAFGNKEKENDAGAAASPSPKAEEKKEAPKSAFSLFGSKPTEDATKSEAPKIAFPSFGSKPAADKPVTTEAPKASFPSFGTKATEKKEENGEEKKLPTFGTGLGFGGPALTFGSSAPAPTGLSFGSGSLGGGAGGGLFGNLTAKANENAEKANEEENEEYVPPKVEVVEGSEADALFSFKGSIFKLVDKEYTKLGVGMVHVKKTDEKHSILIRAATSTGTVWLNAIINNSMKVVNADAKGDKIRLTCPTSATEMTTFLIRFASTKEQEKIVKVIEENNK